MVYITNESLDELQWIVQSLASGSESSGRPVAVTIETRTVGGSSVRLSGLITPKEKVDKGKPKRVRGGEAEGEHSPTYECDGVSHTVSEWAEVIGVTCQTIRNRIKSTGNPYGRKGPTGEDMVKASTKLK